MATLGSAFVPVTDTARSAAWYSDVFGVRAHSVDDFAAVLSDGEGRRVTLLGPASGIRATPGLPWASCSYLVEDVHAFRETCPADWQPGPVEGDPTVCLFLTLRDPDGNVVLVVDR